MTTSTATETKAKKAPKAKVAKVKAPATKASAAQKVFNRMYPQVLAGKKARKDVLAKLIETAGLSEAGASTYYQNMKKKVAE